MRQLGIQTLGVLREMNADTWGTLQTLKDGGLSYLEILSDWGADPAMLAFYKSLNGGIDAGWSRMQIRENLPRLRTMGMDLKGMFVFLDRLLPEVENLADFCVDLRIEYVVFSLMDIGDSLAKCEAAIAKILAVGRVLQAHGVEMVVHNHETDFVRIRDESGEEKTLFDRLLEGCEEIGLKVELDTGWAIYAGLDPVDLIRRLGRKVRILHIKDLAKGFEAMDRNSIYVPAGTGVSDYAAIFSAAESYADPDYRIVLDQDPSGREGLSDNLASAAYLKRLLDATA